MIDWLETFVSMRRLSKTVPIGVLLSACNPSPALISPGVPPELKHSWEVSFNKGDAASVAALYTPDAQLLISGEKPAIGPIEIQRVVQEMIDNGLKAKIDTTQNVASGEIAYVKGTYVVWKGEVGAQVEQGGFVELWRRQDGTWRIFLDVNASVIPRSAVSTPK
jgi:uncharacterized protein (TIGR02246 family)